MQFAPGLDPKKLRGKPGAKAKYVITDVLDSFVDEMTTGKWESAAIAAHGMSSSTFAELKKVAVSDGRVEKRGKVWIRSPKIHSINPMTGESRIRDLVPLDVPHIEEESA